MPRKARAVRSPALAARAIIIREVMQELDRLDGEIKTLQDERTRVKTERIRGELKMDLADFALLRKLAGMADQQREALLETLREGFAALKLGAPPVVTSPPVPEEELAPEDELELPITSREEARASGYVDGKLGTRQPGRSVQLNSHLLEAYDEGYGLGDAWREAHGARTGH